MTTVSVQPMPEWIRKVSKKYRPVHPPVFVDIGPEGILPEDVELARELFGLLDPLSAEWYGGDRFLERWKKPT